LEGDQLFGRRITPSGWLKLGGLAFVVLAILFIICAPLTTISVRVDLPPPTATSKPMTASEWVGLLFVLNAALLFLILLGAAVWLVMRTAIKIVRAQPKI